MFKAEYPNLLKEYGVKIEELPEPLKNKITYFEAKVTQAGITEDELEQLDSAIFGDIQDWLAEQEADDSAAAPPPPPPAEPAKTTPPNTPPATTASAAPPDTSTYPTAASTTKKPESVKSKDFFDTLFGN